METKPETKVLVISDSHKNIDRMVYAVETEKPDVIVHLGDHIADAKKLEALYPGTELYMVVGNMDDASDGTSEIILEIDGVKILVTHGHRYGVKEGFETLFARGRTVESDIILYGHTHKALLTLEFRRWYMNPGYMQNHDSVFTSTYGLIHIKNGHCSFEIKSIPKNYATVQ